MSKTREQDMADRRAAKLRKQRGRGAAKKKTELDYVPLSKVATTQKFRQMRKNEWEAKHKQKQQERDKVVDEQVTTAKQEIEKFGVTTVRRADVATILKGVYKNTDVRWAFFDDAAGGGPRTVFGKRRRCRTS